MITFPRHRTVAVQVGRFQVGGGAPIVVQSMTQTDTADAAATARQAVDLAEAGSELVRITVNVPEASRPRRRGVAPGKPGQRRRPLVANDRGRGQRIGPSPG